MVYFSCQNSLNGTYINDNAIIQSDQEEETKKHWVKLSDGDLIGLGVTSSSAEDEFYFVFKLTKVYLEVLGKKVVVETFSSWSGDLEFGRRSSSEIFH